MADYNIYIHAFSGKSSATTPFQLKEGTADDSNFSAKQLIQRAGSFVSNPDSAFGAVSNAASGALESAGGMALGVGLTMLALKMAINIADKIVTTYHSFVDSRTGDYGMSIRWNNAKTIIGFMFTPISSTIAAEKRRNEEIIANANNEQQRILYGGTIYKDRYGRYL